MLEATTDAVKSNVGLLSRICLRQVQYFIHHFPSRFEQCSSCCYQMFWMCIIIIIHISNVLEYIIFNLNIFSMFFMLLYSLYYCIMIKYGWPLQIKSVPSPGYTIVSTILLHLLFLYDCYIFIPILIIPGEKYILGELYVCQRLFDSRKHSVWINSSVLTYSQ